MSVPAFEPGTLHDFKNLLTVISGHSELLLARLKQDDPLWRSAEAIRRAVESGVSLTTQWLTAARRDAAPTEVVELNDLVATVARMFDGPIGSDVELDLRLGDDAGRVRVSRAEVEQVLVNLAMNARDAMPEGGRLTIETRSLEIPTKPTRRLSDPLPGTWAVVEVTDTGVGMEPAVASRLFEPWFTTKPGRGTGLGLATAQAVVRRHGGEITVTTQAGCGSTFRVCLPRVLSAPPTENGASKDGAVHGLAAVTENPRGTETILVVEPDPELRELTSEVLELHGYRVLAVETAEQAEVLASRHTGTIHLVVADLLAEGRDGGGLAAALRRRRPRVKSLYVSALTDPELARRNGRLDGLLLRKPFAIGALARRVREALDR